MQVLYSYTTIITIYLMFRKQYILANLYLVFLIPQYLQARSLQVSLVSSFYSLVGIYIFLMKVSRLFESYSKPLASAFFYCQVVASLLYSLYISQSYISVIASQYIGTRVSLSFLSITLLSQTLLLVYSSFLLSISTLVFSTPLIYEIRKLYITKVSTQQTYYLFSSFIVVKQIRFL